jgi:hypothetical protein
MQLSAGQSTSGDREQASRGSSDKAQGESTTNDASEHISLSLGLEGRADEEKVRTIYQPVYRKRVSILLLIKILVHMSRMTTMLIIFCVFIITVAFLPMNNLRSHYREDK